MRLLLDTHLLIWAAYHPQRIPTEAREMIESRENELFYSAASLWEIVIKSEKKRPDFNIEPYGLMMGLQDNGYVEMPVKSQHTLAVGNLPLIHKDPFDRILVAQAQAEGLLLLTTDSVLAQYPGPIQFFKK